MDRHTDGKFTVEINAGGSLGTYTEMIEQVQAGSLQMTFPAEGHIAPIYPNINVYALPYAFRDPQHALYVFDTEFGDQLRQDMVNETGIRMLGWWENGGMRNFFVNTDNAGTELREPADLEGLRFRTMEIQAHMEIVESLGAQAEPIAWTELYNAIEQGVVDGAELPIPVYMIPNLYEITDWMIMDRHVYSMAMAITNDEWFRDLPAEYQSTLAQGMNLANMHARRIGQLLRRRGRGFIESRGVTVYDPTPEALAEFRSLTQGPVEELVREEVADESMVDDLKSAIGDATETLQYETSED
jgi:tripartite ATP-independent transporter DctP family solute receptor